MSAKLHVTRITCDRPGEGGPYTVGDIARVDGEPLTDDDIALIERLWRENTDGANDDVSFFKLLSKHPHLTDEPPVVVHDLTVD